jgi:hypothetical protein
MFVFDFMCVCRKGVDGNVINKYEMEHVGRDQTWHNDGLSYSNMHQMHPAELLKRGNKNRLHRARATKFYVKK